MRRVVGIVAILALGVGGLAAFAWPHVPGDRPPVSQTAGGPVRHGETTGTSTATFTVPTSRPSAAPAAPPRRMKTPRRRADYLVLIVLDGARPDYFSVPGIPHVRALIQNGTEYTNGFAGILESETPSGHASIGTGSLPNQDGILSFAWANSDNTTVDLFDPSQITGGTMERIIRDAPAPTLAGLVKAHDRSARVVVTGGHKYYAQDAMAGPRADVILYYTGTPNGRFVPVAVPGHVPPRGVIDAPGLIVKSHGLPLGVEDHLATTLAIRSFQRLHQKVTMINQPEFDWPLGHVDGAERDPVGVRTLMHRFDSDLAALEDAYRRAGVLSRTLFVLTADHGFAPIDHTVSAPAIQSAVDAAGTRIISDTYHTAGYIWLQDGSKAAAAAANIAKLQNPYIQAVYFREPAPSGGYDYIRASGPDLLRAEGMETANQYLLSTFDGPHAPDVVVFFTETAGSLPGGQASWKADHGGADWESQHIPLIFSGPGVRRGAVSDAPARLEDISPTALTLMGIPDTGMGGIPLADAMADPPAALLRGEERVRAHLLPVVTSLRREARLEVRAGL